MVVCISVVIHVIIGFRSSTTYNKIFSDLSDVEIPLERLHISTELGEGTYNNLWTCNYIPGSCSTTVFVYVYM